ncbi:hypothetical protein F4805DRAFT_5736 [Annulohypoxylon moriforme]|nr:hypothetical protein F4805DRAFT_5736 [Annulohypoxylon moriforme]
MIDEFLVDSFEGINRASRSGSYPILTIMTNNRISTTPSQPPIQSFNNPYAGHSVEYILHLFPRLDFFAILDERSILDRTALVVASSPSDGLQVVRAPFASTEAILVALISPLFTIQTFQEIAAHQGGVCDLLGYIGRDS